MLRSVKTSAATRIGLALMTVTFWSVGVARAQSTYVGASALADVARFGSTGFGRSSGGEAFGGAIRVGTAIADRWGLDLEFARPGEIEQDYSFDFAVGIPALTSLVGLRPGTAVQPGAMPVGGGRIGSIFPPPFSVTTTQRHSTLTVMPWVRQSLGSRADIVYLGGLALLRTTSRTNYGGVIRLLGGSSGIGESTVSYGSAPAVGLDVRVAMTEHLRLVPGVRLLAVDEGGQTGWLTRPSVGLQWTF
jgi:hypothetical protein